MPEMKTVTLASISPFIRYARSIDVSLGQYPTPIVAYDCRLFYVTRGEGSIAIGSETYTLGRGDLVMWQSGTPYRIDTHGQFTLSCLAINFDFTRSHAQRNYPFPPVKYAAFSGEKVMEQVQFTDVPRFNDPVYAQGMQQVEDILLEMKREDESKKAYCSEHMSGLMISLLSRLARKQALGYVEQAEPERKIEKVLNHIHQNYEKNITNEALGQLFSYHPNYLNKLMVLYTGNSLHQYLLTHRISQAITMIVGTDMPLSEIAEAVGYKDYCHFSKLFKQKTGNRPQDFRRDKQ